MPFASKRQRIFSTVVFSIYLALLVWLILFKLSINLGELSRFRSVNWRPFYYATDVRASFHAREILYNVLVFVPLGVYLSIFFPARPFYSNALLCLGLSLAFEAAQYVFAIGASDITDVIANTAGGLIGLSAGSVCSKHLPLKFITVVNWIGLVIEILCAALITVLFLANR